MSLPEKNETDSTPPASSQSAPKARTAADVPHLVGGRRELPWFAEVLERSRVQLKNEWDASPGSVPSWYRDCRLVGEPGLRLPRMS